VFCDDDNEKRRTGQNERTNERTLAYIKMNPASPPAEKKKKKKKVRRKGKKPFARTHARALEGLACCLASLSPPLGVQFDSTLGRR